MMRFTVLLIACALVSACNMSGVEKEADDSFSINMEGGLQSDSAGVIFETSKTEIDEPIDTLYLENDIYIVYLAKGDGSKVKKNDVVMIDYKSKLTDGKIFDTNEKLGKPIPFMVGWGLQTKGWDIVMPFLREGDELNVFLPAKYARGEKGIPNLVPPNSDNIVKLKIHSIRNPDYVDDGVEVWVINRGEGQPDLKVGSEVLIDYFAYSESTPRYDNSFKSGEPYKLKVGGANNLPGLNIGLTNAKLSDKLWIRIPSKHAFGVKGNQDLVKPNETIFFDLRVLKVVND